MGHLMDKEGLPVQRIQRYNEDTFKNQSMHSSKTV